jgi:hypothetical protein
LKSEQIVNESIAPAAPSEAPPPATRLSWFRARRAAQKARPERADSGPVPKQPEAEAPPPDTGPRLPTEAPQGAIVADPSRELVPPAFDAPPEASALAQLSAAETAEVLAAPAVMPNEQPARFSLTRVFALLALTALFAAVGRGVIAAYYAVTDAFVTPIILTPDSDLVLPSKLSLANLLGERQTWEMRGAAASAAMEVADRGIAKLTQLRDATAKALAWSDMVSSTMQGSTEKDLSALEQQKQLLEQHLADQRAYVAEMQHNLEAGLARKSDVLREQATVSQLQVELLDNQRAQLASAALHRQNSLEQEALRGQHQGLRTPQMLQQQDQLVRIELELTKLQADKSTRSDELRVANDEMHKLDALIAEMKRRPVFRAVESRQNVAFLPYAQSDGVTDNAAVYECRILGMFACERVGNVLEVLPGEVNMQDPWGTPTRGQYALLDLDDPRAARAKALRLRARERDLTGLVTAWWSARR